MTRSRFAVLMLVCMIWGLHFTVIRVTVDDVPPIFYAGIRMVIVALLLSPFLRWHSGRMVRIAIAGVCLGGLNYAFMFSGVKMTSASIGAIMVETYAPIATILSVLFLGERIGRWRISGLVLAFAGAILVVASREMEGSSGAVIPGALLILCGATCEAVGAIFVKKVDGVSPFGLLAWFAIFGACVTLPLSLLVESDQLGFWAGDARWTSLGGLAYSVFLASLLGHASYYWLLQGSDVSRVAGGGLMLSVFGVFFGVTLLGEPLTLMFLVGSIITIAGVGIVVFRTERRRSGPRPNPLIAESEIAS
jgi:O-acetylserine/cysteine efflux transporter